MKTLLDNQEIEKTIEKCALLFKAPGLEFEDFVQVGRIAVWRMLEKRPDITTLNIKDHIGFVYQTAKFGMQNEVVSTRTKKRSVLNTAHSLDAPIGEGDLTLGILLPDNQEALFNTLDKDDSKKLLKKLELRAIKERTRELVSGVIWLLVHMLDIERKDIPKKLTYATFAEYGLVRFLWIFFNNSPSRAVHYAYPGEFKRFQTTAPLRYWNGVHGRKRAKKALQEALELSGYSQDVYPRLMTIKFFEEFRLIRPLEVVYNQDRFAYLQDVFPHQYEPWEFSTIPKRLFENEEMVKRAVRWLVEKKLGYDMKKMSVHSIWDERIAIKITKDTFSEYGLSELNHTYYSPEIPLRMTYPDKFLEWSFQSKTKWVGEEGRVLAAKAVRWLIEDHCKISPNSQEITWKFFVENGLNGMLSTRKLGFNSSPRKALENAYPDMK